MSELTEFLLARIAEDEEWARPASGILGMKVAWHEPDVLHQRGINRADSHHIARWDPARVLAECDAKRRIVEFHAQPMVWIGPGQDDFIAGDFRQPADHHTLRLLALPYADHADYDERWRP